MQEAKARETKKIYKKMFVLIMLLHLVAIPTGQIHYKFGLLNPSVVSPAFTSGALINKFHNNPLL